MNKEVIRAAKERYNHCPKKDFGINNEEGVALLEAILEILIKDNPVTWEDIKNFLIEEMGYKYNDETPIKYSKEILEKFSFSRMVLENE